MKRSFWQSRITLVVLGVAAGLVARAVLGPPAPEVPPKPSFSRPLPDEVPVSLPKPEQPIENDVLEEPPMPLDRIGSDRKS